MGGDWSLPPEVFAFLRKRLLPSAAVVELGSGEGTRELVRCFGRVHTVEHDPEWLGKVEGARYIHAPIVNGWYDIDALGKGLPLRYDCLIVDGPPGSIGRGGLARFLSVFNQVPVVLDDVHRKAEYELAVRVAKQRGENLSIHYLKSGRAFATVGWADF